MRGDAAMETKERLHANTEKANQTTNHVAGETWD